MKIIQFVNKYQILYNEKHIEDIQNYISIILKIKLITDNFVQK